MLLFHCPFPSGLQSPPANHICCLQAENTRAHSATSRHGWNKHFWRWGGKNKKRETLIWTHEGNAWHASEYLVGLETDGVFEANRDLPQNTSEIMGVIVSLRYVWLLLSKRQTEMNADCTGMHLLMLLRLVFLSLKCCVSASYSCWQI